MRQIQTIIQIYIDFESILLEKNNEQTKMTLGNGCECWKKSRLRFELTADAGFELNEKHVLTKDLCKKTRFAEFELCEKVLFFRFVNKI